MRTVAKVSIFAIAIALSACASSGVKIDQSKMASLHKGQTTYSEVIQRFGRPTNDTITADGSRMVMYHYFSAQAHPENFIPIVGAFAGGADTETTMVMLQFNQNGILTTYTSSQGGSGMGMGFEGISQDRKSPREVE
jgi:outer membrane protein assembly factor BamE (lipoprotein component of BamABCDE complex)